MAEHYTLKCKDCGAEQSANYASFCACGGLIEAQFDLDNVRLRDSDDPHQRYFDLIPVRDERLLAPGLRTRTSWRRGLPRRWKKRAS